MKKEYTEIFWGLYAIKKDAEKLQEQFMPEKDRALITCGNSVKIPSKLAYFVLTNHALISKYLVIA